MFYFYTQAIPAVIVLLGYLLTRRKPSRFPDFVGLLLKVSPVMFGYIFLLNYLDMNGWVDSGWAVYTLFFFTVPIFFTVLLFKLYFVRRAKRLLK